MARVYSISTGERVHAWQPHEDYIRSITVHPTLPIILTASDDCTIKSWDWDKAWRCTQVSLGRERSVCRRGEANRELEIGIHRSQPLHHVALDRKAILPHDDRCEICSRLSELL